MSTPSTPAPTADATPLKVLIVSHTGLLYWWPVWVVGFLLAFLTYWEDTRLAVLPPGAVVTTLESKKGFQIQVVDRPGPMLDEAIAREGQGKDPFPVRMSWKKGFGIVYFAVVLLVILGSNIPLRGLSSLLAVLSLLAVVILFTFLDWWGPILEFLGGLHIQMSMAAYLLPSVVLLVIWVVSVFFYDHLRSVCFTPGQVTVYQDIGTQSQAYDATMIQVEKRPMDLLRHWILGFGAGDIIVRLANQGVQFEISNVLFVDHCMAKIARIIATKQVDPTAK